MHPKPPKTTILSIGTPKTGPMITNTVNIVSSYIRENTHSCGVGGLLLGELMTGLRWQAHFSAVVGSRKPGRD